MKKKKTSDEQFTIIIDSREKKFYKFKNAVVKALKTGDYSVLGLENEVSVERKSKSDLYGSLGKGRERFEREVQRLSLFNYGAIVIESSLKGLLKPPKYSRMNPKAVVNSLISWSIKYKIHVFFAENRIYGKAITYRILEKYVTIRNNTK